MGPFEDILIVAAVLAIAGAVVRWVRRRGKAPPDPREDLLDAVHRTIDEIELARVRSMLQRR